MGARLEPIMLFGFCFVTQQKQSFNNSWACAFHTSWYTDEQHHMWDTIEDNYKRREIRYGNNIAVLFRALLHCKRFYGQDSLWAAIARGFNTSQTVVKTTVNILTEARRIQRRKFAKEISDTALAADDWIDFLDSEKNHPRMLSDPEVYKVAEAFFSSQEKKILNAANVPVNSHRPPLSLNTYRPSSNGKIEEADSSPRLPPTPSIKPDRLLPESPRDAAAAEKNRLIRPTRKRSASPVSTDRSPKIMRRTDIVNGQSRTVSDAQRQQDQPHRTQPPTPSPRSSSHTQLPPSGPRAEASTGREVSNSAPGRYCIDVERSALRARIGSLEKELATAKSKLSDAAAAEPASSQISADIGGLEKDMTTVTNAVSTMMESMHYLVDSMNSVRDEVTGLSKQQGDIATASAQADKSESDSLLRPIQSLTDNVRVLGEEISALKKQASEQQQQPAAAVSQAAQEDSNSELKTLLLQQNSRIDQLTREVTNMQSQMVSSPLSRQQSPQNLRQAMSAAERDLTHHLSAVQSFYYQLDSRGANRAVTERTADFLATLQQSVHSAAQLGQQG